MLTKACNYEAYVRSQLANTSLFVTSNILFQHFLLKSIFDQNFSQRLLKCPNFTI